VLNSKLHIHNSFDDNRGTLGILEHNILDIKWDRTITSYNKNIHTFRGMHYQEKFPQIKYIKVIKGKIIDFIYNLDTNQVEEYELDSTLGLLVPNNYAHGYFTLEEDTIVSYLICGDYIPSDERIISYKDISEISKYIDRYDITIGNKDLITY